MIGVLGFTTILGAFGGVGVWARLAYRRGVVNGPFNPTYRLSLIVGIRKIGRMEDGMGEKYPSAHTSSHKETKNPLDSPIQ